jgi:hypothetical protein
MHGLDVLFCFNEPIMLHTSTSSLRIVPTIDALSDLDFDSY